MKSVIKWLIVVTVAVVATAVGIIACEYFQGK